MIAHFALSCLFLAHLSQAWFYGRPEPGATTQGKAWPLPQKQILEDFNHTIDAAAFEFLPVDNFVSDVLKGAIKKYQRWTFPDYKATAAPANVAATLLGLQVKIKNNPEDVGYPQLEMDESYNLTIPSTPTGAFAILEANEVWGAIRGLDTFSQLVYQPSSNEYRVRATTINDFPRFPHRGILMDSCRHFLAPQVIKHNLDLMAQNKMNVLHWHLVDSEAFPYTSMQFPNLSIMGAYTEKHIYSVEDMKEVIEYARVLGIRVVAEFDSPGHTGAWGPGQPGLLSKCYDSQGNNNILGNIIDPSKPENFRFLEEFFKEALELFPDNYMHFGGDEVSSYMLQCWYRNKEVRNWMSANGFGDDTYKVLNYYFQELFKIVARARKGTEMVVWQEVLDNNVNAENTIAHVWKGSNYDEMMAEMATVTKAGHKAILSSCWYLNFIKYGNDWGYIDNPNIRQRGLYYECDPTGFEGTDEQKKLVLGGEAVMWAEFVDGTNLIPRLWPRASAVAERLWSNAADTKSADAAWPRLHEHRCRMMRRGYPVQPPNNPDFCPTYWDPDYPDLH